MFSQEVRINGESGKLKDLIPLKEGDAKISVLILLKNGAEYFFETKDLDIKPEYNDLVQSEAKDGFILSGTGPEPISGEKQILKNSWKVRLKSQDPVLYFSGANQIPLRQYFKFTKKPPSEELRPLIESNVFSTYRDEVPLRGSVNEGVSATSTENDVKKIDTTHFEWNFKTSEILNQNKRHLKLLDKKDEYISSQSIYRALPYEVVGRVSGVLSSTSFLFSGDLGGSAWLQQIFKSESPRWSVLRWGVSSNFHQSFNSVQDANGSPINLTQVNLSLKYRLSPGVVNKDETWGLGLAYQSVTYSSAPASMLGAEVFWNHPIFKIVDNVFNKVKWFRNPKWLEAYLQIYPLPVSSVTLGTNFNFSLKVKIFFKPRFFYDLGVGLSSFNYTKAQTYIVNTGSVAGTLGLGYIF
jgi:hypothetical protein